MGFISTDKDNGLNLMSKINMTTFGNLEDLRIQAYI